MVSSPGGRVISQTAVQRRLAPQIVNSVLSRVPLKRAVQPLPQDRPAPLPFRYNWRRAAIMPDYYAIFHERGNGLQIPDVLTDAILEEAQYQEWLRRTGFNGKNVGTRPEYMVYTALERMGYRAPATRPYPGLDFDDLGGPGGTGQGFDADILLYFTSPETIINVQGEYFHFADDPTIASDILKRQQQESTGRRVIDILGQDTWTRRRVEYVVQLAINGMEVDTSGKLSVFR